MKRTVLLVVTVLAAFAASAQQAPPQSAYPVYPNQVPPPLIIQPARTQLPMLPARPMRDPSGLVTITPPQEPPGARRQSASTCFISYIEYPMADRNNDGQLSYGEINRYCRR